MIFFDFNRMTNAFVVYAAVLRMTAEKYDMLFPKRRNLIQLITTQEEKYKKYRV